MEECSSCSGSEYEVEESGCVLGFGELGRDGEMHLEHSVVQQEEEEVRLDGVAKRQSLWSEYMECIMEELLNRIVDLRKPIYSRELEKNRQEKQIKEEQMRRQSLALREQLLRSKSKKKTKTAHSSDKRISDTSGKIALVIKKPEVGIPPKLAVKLNPIPRQSSKSTTSKRSRSRRNSRDMWSSTWNSDSSSSDEDLNMFDDLSIGSEDEEDEDLEEELRLIEQKKNSNSSGSQTVLKIKLGDNRDQLSLTTSAMSQVDYMNELIVKFMRLDKFQIFIDPVDPAVVPMYYEVIKDPMDFSKIKENIGNGKYQSLSQFQADVNLVFQNCICFNGKDTLYHRQALLLKNQCGRLIREAMEKYGCVELNPFVLDYIPIEDFCYPVDEEDVRRKMSTSIAGDCSSVENQCCTDLAKLGPFNISTGKFISSCKDRFLSRECGPKCACDPKLCQNRLDSIKEVSAWLGKRLSFGIDQYTYRQLFKALPSYSKSGEHLPKAIRDEFLEEIMINALNEFVPQSWNEIRQNVHMEYSMSKLVERISFIGPMSKQEELSLLFARSILSAIRSRRERFPVYSKGYGIVNKSECTIRKNSIIAEYIGEVYPAWRFSEKQCVMRQMQRKYSSTHTIGFYNIVMERHLDDPEGYDVVYVDACRKANLASRFSHSCNPNCATVVYVSGGRYTIVVTALRDISSMEELTFNYHSVTESKDEFENAICFCGQSMCAGRYVDYVGNDAFLQVVEKEHSFIARSLLLLQSCHSELTVDDRALLEQSGFRSLTLRLLPEWLVKYACELLRFVIHEKRSLPEYLLKEQEYVYTEESAEITAHGVYMNRLQSIVVVLDKVRYLLNRPGQLADPPLHWLEGSEVIHHVWKGPSSLIGELTKSITPHLTETEQGSWIELTSIEITGDDGEESVKILRNQLLLIRDFLRSLTPSTSAYHHAAADILHLYAFTSKWFIATSYNTVSSPVIEVSELGLNITDGDVQPPKPKRYSSSYIWAALSFWMNQTVDKPELNLWYERRCTLQLPSLRSCYSANPRHQLKEPYLPLHRKTLLDCFSFEFTEIQKDKWFQYESNNNLQLFGSPFLDHMLNQGDLAECLDGLTSWEPQFDDTRLAYQLLSPVRKR